MGAPSLLIVDDDQAELALIARLARDTFPGGRLRVAAGGAAALEACGEEQFDCVVLDYSMPGMDGLVCAQRLRAAHAYLPIVMSTGHGDEMLAAHAMTHGVTDYIPKSRITGQSLNRVVENAIRVTGQARVIDEQRNELENFAFALAHDFKQPIRQITTFANLVSDAIQDGRAGEVAQHLVFLTDAARRLASLVEVMAQYTLLGQPPAIGEVGLGKVLDGVRASLAPYVAERHGSIASGALPMVRGNEALIAQVLQNLIVNGLKYNRSVAPEVRITAETEAEQCILRVRDNGIGIAPQYAEEIFKPLMRLHTKSEYAGTGLGLTLARKALANMGGSIACLCLPEGGTEFVVRIALAQAQVPASH